jgi:hypothetical protein
MALTQNIAVGRNAQLNINAKTLCFARAVPRSTREIVSNPENQMCGDIDPVIDRVTKGRHMVAWSFFIDITWAQVQVVFPLLGLTDGAGPGPWSMGATDEVTGFPVVINFGDIRHTIADAVVARWALRGQKGSKPVQMQIDIVGDTEVTGAAFVEDFLAFDAEYAFHHATLTLEDDAGPPGADTSRTFDRFMLQVDNGLVLEHNNSVTLTDATIGDRKCIFATSVPYITAHDELYEDYRDNDGGKKAVFVLSNGVKILTFTIPTGVPIAKPASIMGKADQIRTPVTLWAHRSDSVGRVAPMTIAASGP